MVVSRALAASNNFCDNGSGVVGLRRPAFDICTLSLAYKNESGAIEEAIADIMSQGVERHANGGIWRIFCQLAGIKYLQSDAIGQAVERIFLKRLTII